MAQIRTGFSLVELSIVLVIIGVLVAMSLSLGSGQVGVANIKATQAKLDRIDQAIGTYLKTNGALPCPADGTASTSSIGVATATTGNSSFSDATCATPTPNFTSTGSPGGSVYIGIVPVRLLGLSDDYAFDAWGNRIMYAVSKYCVDPDNWSGNYTYKCVNTATGGTVAPTTDRGDNIAIYDLSGTGSGVSKATAAYAVFSLGKDGYGGYTRAGTKTAAAPSGNKKELNNSSASYTSAVFNDGLINDGTNATNYFDDIVHWKTAARTWDDAYGGNLLPSCTAGYILVSNGGTSYSCSSQQNFMGTVLYEGNPTSAGPDPNLSTASNNCQQFFSSTYSAVTGPNDTCAAAGGTWSDTTTFILSSNPNWQNATYIGVHATCMSASTTSDAWVRVHFTGAATMQDYDVCNIDNGGSSETNQIGSAILKIPYGTTSISIRGFSSSNTQNPTTYAHVQFLQ